MHHMRFLKISDVDVSVHMQARRYFIFPWLSLALALDVFDDRGLENVFLFHLNAVGLTFGLR